MLNLKPIAKTLFQVHYMEHVHGQVYGTGTCKGVDTQGAIKKINNKQKDIPSRVDRFLYSC